MSKQLFRNPRYSYLESSKQTPYKHEAKRRAINAVKKQMEIYVTITRQLQAETDRVEDIFKLISVDESDVSKLQELLNLDTNKYLMGYIASGIKETTELDLRQSGYLTTIPNNDLFQQFLLSKLVGNPIYDPIMDRNFSTKFGEEFNITLKTFCSYIFRLICNITVVAHGGSSMGHSDTNLTTMSAIFFKNPTIKTNVSALGCPTLTTKPERFLLASILSKVLNNIPRLDTLNRDASVIQLKSIIIDLLAQNRLLQEYLKTTKAQVCSLAQDPTNMKDGTFNSCISSYLTFEQCKMCQVGEIYDSKTHISNRLYGLTDLSLHKKIAIIYITFFFIDTNGNIRPLTKELKILFNYLGNVLDENGDITDKLFETIFLSDLLKPNYTFLRIILTKEYGCPEEQVELLILTLIIMLFDASCGGGNTVHTFSGYQIYGGKTKNKKTKNKKTKKQKMKKRKTKKRKTKNN